MAEYTGFFDSIAYPSVEEALTRYAALLSGVTPGFDNELEVTTGTGLQVKVDSGFLWHLGRYYYQDEDASGGTPKTLSIDAATAGYNRKDRIIVEFDILTPAITLKVSKGTETTGTPTAPTLNADEASLAIVDITASTINSITDDRTIGGARVREATETQNGIVELATQAEAEAGTSNNVVMTALRVAQAIAALAPQGSFCESYYTGSNITSDGFVLWNNDRYDVDDMHNVSSNQQYFVAQNSNWHDIKFFMNAVEVSGGGSIIYQMEVYNSSNVLQRSYRKYLPLPNIGNYTLDGSFNTYLNAGEKVALNITSISANATINGGSSGDETSCFTIKEDAA